MRKPNNKLANYECIRSSIKTGDLIAFSGNHKFSNLIKWVTDSKYSHVGMVIRSDMGPGFGDSVLVIESTTDTSFKDYLDRVTIRGVQLHWLSKRASSYDGEVYWCPLLEHIKPNNLMKMESWLRETHDNKTPYDDSQVWGAGIDLLDSLFENKSDFNRLFCSELIAKALTIADLLNDNMNPSELTPKDIVNLSIYGEPIRIN
jgi:hypothetical protein